MEEFIEAEGNIPAKLFHLLSQQGCFCRSPLSQESGEISCDQNIKPCVYIQPRLKKQQTVIYLP